MLLTQALRVLPAAAKFNIYDDGNLVLSGEISSSDHSIYFPDINDCMQYEKFYNIFKVIELDKVDDIWKIQIR